METLKDLPENGSILEIASGNRRYALKFAEELKLNKNQQEISTNKPKNRIVGVEISQVGVNLIRQKARNQNLELEVVCADFLMLNLSEQFDAVFSSGLLEELETESEQIEAVSKMLKMVKTGGKIILKYCLFISGRSPENRVNSELIPNFLATFPNLGFQVETDLNIRFNNLSTIQDNQNNIRTQTVIIHKVS